MDDYDVELEFVHCCSQLALSKCYFNYIIFQKVDRAACWHSVTAGYIFSFPLPVLYLAESLLPWLVPVTWHRELFITPPAHRCLQVWQNLRPVAHRVVTSVRACRGDGHCLPNIKECRRVEKHVESNPWRLHVLLLLFHYAASGDEKSNVGVKEKTAS